MQSDDRLGPYELVCPVGAGGMGEVWKARDTRLDRFVAIKISKESFDDRVLQEARTIAKLDHAHICRLYDIGPDYLVMELLDGRPLAGPLPVQAALMYAIEICSALFEAHHTGITHRDLKPANILVTRNGVVLLDFGLAKVDSILAAGAGDATIIEKTRPGQILGTLHYMSPEQLQGKSADPGAISSASVWCSMRCSRAIVQSPQRIRRASFPKSCWGVCPRWTHPRCNFRQRWAD